MSGGSVAARAAAFGLLAILAASVGCSEYSVELAAPDPLPASNQLRVGAARTEITPPPGLPMGGYGFIGKVARGVWTRLYANALVIEDAAGTPLVLVACDLWSMPAGLADEVVARVQADPGRRGQGIGRAHVVIAATHTHQSPGGYSSSVGYNSLPAPEPFYDPALFDFLAARISDAILRAAANRAEARMIWQDEHVAGLARNRMFKAFTRNPARETADFLSPAGGGPLCDLRAPVPDRRACRAVDATVTVVRFERNGGIVGAAVFATLHPTATGPDLALYASDVYGIAAHHAAAELARNGGQPPVIAFFNGAEGDVSPDWRIQDGTNTRAIGRRLGERVVELAHGGTPEQKPTIVQAFKRVRVAGACTVDADGRERCAARRAMVGRATLAGATDGRTHFLPWLFRDGVTRRPLGAQGVKVPAFDPGIGWLRLPITSLMMLALGGPTDVPLGVHRLGPLAIATLPGEFTTMMGRRIAATVAGAMPSARRVLLAGLANEYLSYFTTPEEYGGQFYEGASTLYGPQSGPVVARALGELAAAAEGGTVAPEPQHETLHYSPGPSRSYGLEDVEPAHTDDDGLGHLLREPPYDAGPQYPSICWHDAASTFPDARYPHVAVEIARGEEWEPLAGADNLGVDFITLASPRDDGGAAWRALWMPPPDVAADARLRLVVEPLEGTQVRGAPFTLAGDDLASFCDTP